ncbi:MAG: fimbrillin family protein [Rikenellaceae bacterium]|jgi:hypothetical protein|nr:fimbrillin family protein [Rikenellaceae bacterium]
MNDNDMTIRRRGSEAKNCGAKLLVSHSLFLIFKRSLTSHCSFLTYRSLLVPLFSFLILLVACDRETAPDETFRQQLVLASQTENATRGTVDDTWQGGERVRVSLDNGAAEVFIAATDGMLTPIASHWWYSQAQMLSARGWYPDPVDWSFLSDQSGGLQPVDFVFASTVTGIKYNNYYGNPLVFRHRTARVTVNLSAGTDIADVSGATVLFYGYTSGTIDTSDTGDGAIAGSGGGWITPCRTPGTDTYTALLIPRDMTGIKFVKVSLGEYDYYYTPLADQAVLDQGNGYLYNIAVGKTRLTVAVVSNGATWDASTGGTVTAEPVREP